MVVRLPAPDEPASFGPPIVAPATDGAPDLPDDAKAALARMQARDDALFIATALADLTARRRVAALAAKDAARTAEDGGFDGYARRLDAEFAADAKRMVEERQALSGPRPSAEAIGLFRRRAGSMRRTTLAHNAVVEDELRRAAQQRGIESAIGGLATAVEAEPEALDEALERLSDLTGAAAALVGAEPAAALYREAGAGLAAAAARGLIAADPAGGLAAIQGGAFDDRLDDAARARLLHEAESRSQAAARDAAPLHRNQAAEAARQAEARALAFTGDFRRRMATGEASHAGIAAARADGTVSQACADALSAALDDSLAARAAEEAALRQVGAALLDGRRLDSAKPDDRTAAALYFDVVLAPTLADLPPHQRADLIADYVAATEIAPDNALRALAGIVIAGEAADRVQAAQMLTDLVQRHAPDGDVLPSGILRLADDIAALATYRISAEKAIGLVESGRHDLLAGRADQVKIRFEPPDGSENTGAQPESVDDD